MPSKVMTAMLEEQETPSDVRAGGWILPGVHAKCCCKLLQGWGGGGGQKGQSPLQYKPTPDLADIFFLPTWQIQPNLNFGKPGKTMKPPDEQYYTPSFWHASVSREAGGSGKKLKSLNGTPQRRWQDTANHSTACVARLGWPL